MPHQCTNCGHTFADGSKEMLSGCPDCGGTKFQFHPDGVPDEPTGESPPEPEGGTISKAADTVRDFVGSDEEPSASGTGADADAATSESSAEDAHDPAMGLDPDAADDDIVVADEEPVPESEREDRAQADARSSVVDREDLPDPEDGEVIEPSSEERPDIDELREELNSQFESIRIVDRGQYELNLMELYDREEYIIALQENGRYVIEVPDSWHGDEDEPPEA